MMFVKVWYSDGTKQTFDHIERFMAIWNVEGGLADTPETARQVLVLNMHHVRAYELEPNEDESSARAKTRARA